MSLFASKKFRDFGANFITGGAYGAGKDADKALQQTNAMNAAAKKKRLELVEQRAAPKSAAETSKRLKYLNQQAAQYKNPLALEQDPTFQGQRSQLVSGATQQAAGIDNAQRATGIRGGTSNMGSVQDSYDRLNTALASLGGEQSKYRTEMADKYMGEAADLGQESINQRIDEKNARLALKDAIEAGNVDAALAALQYYNNIKTTARSSGYQGLQKMAGSAAGGAMGAG